MRKPPDPPQGLISIGPREWMQVWARVIASPSVKCVGAFCAHFGDYETGAEIRPGTELLAKVCGMTPRTVIGALAQIREWEFIWRYSEGKKQGRRGMADVYRLTIPADIFGRVPMLSPDWEEGVDNPLGSPELRSHDLGTRDLYDRNT